MGSLLKITDFHVVPALAFDGGNAFSCGVVLDGRVTIWHLYLPPANGLPPAFDIQAVAETMLKPLLIGRALTQFQELNADLDGLTETVTYMADIPQPPPRREDLPLSRREMLSGGLEGQKEIPTPAPKKEEVTVTRSLPPSFRFAISLLLLKATAYAWQVSIAAALTTLANLVPARNWVGIHAEADFGSRLSRQLMQYPLASLGIRIESAAFAGDRSQLHGHVQQLHDFMQADAAHNPQFGLEIITRPDLRQSLQENMGEVLGLFIDLKGVAAKRPLTFRDPLTAPQPEQWIADLARLQESQKFSRVGVRVSAAAPLESVSLVEQLAAAGAVDRVLLDGARLGSLSAFISAADCCRQAGVEVLMAGGRTPGALLAQLALALQPTLVRATPTPTLSVGLADLYNEMAQTLTGKSLTA